MNGVFSVRGTDKRSALINHTLAQTQKPHGADVEYFSKETGFCLLRKDAKVKYDMAYVKRAVSAATLSRGVPLALREFYYTLGQIPELVDAFSDVKAEMVYAAVLRAINDVEILCDIDRSNFTVGNLTKGFIFYAQSAIFGNKRQKIGFTEEIAREALSGNELDNCSAIIVVEKMAAATRLVTLGFSELTNSVIVTTGGNFNRAIWLIVERFKDTKKIIFLCDADPYGVDMNRTIAVGTESSRHLDFKFHPDTNENIYLAGFFPSIGERLGLPIDKEQKRPSNNKYAMQRIEFLRRYNLVDQRDYDAWLRDQTFELEGLSTTYKNIKGEPVGLPIYLLEYMRFYGIPIKPGLPDDDELKRLFDEKAKEEFKDKIAAAVTYPRWFWKLYNKIQEMKDQVTESAYEDALPDFEDCLREVTAKEIKFHINQQFIDDPTRETFDLKEIAEKLRVKFEFDTTWDQLDDIEKAYEETMEEQPEAEYGMNYEFKPIHNETFLQNEYDIALERIGAKEEDVISVRNAVEWRFGEE